MSVITNRLAEARGTALIDAVRLGLPDFMIVGPMGAGKTSGAQFLADQFGYLRLPIAGTHVGGIRDIARRLWGEEAVNDREKLNTLAVIDDHFPGTWLRNWERAFVSAREAVSHAQRPVVVDDVRRQLEYDALRGRGFVCVRVVANENDRVDRLKITGKYQNAEQLNGRLEQWWPTAVADHEITNDGSLDDYYDALIDVLIRERRRR